MKTSKCFGCFRLIYDMIAKRLVHSPQLGTEGRDWLSYFPVMVARKEKAFKTKENSISYLPGY